MNSRARRGGYTLVEVLGYAAILMVLINLSASILIGTKRLHTLGTLAIDRNEALAEIARDFREAVHASSEIVESAAGLPEIPGIIALATETGDRPMHYSLWRRDEDGRLYLEEYDSGADHRPTLASRKVYPSCLKVRELTVTRGPEAAALLILDLVVDNESTPRTVPKANRFIAALGLR